MGGPSSLSLGPTQVNRTRETEICEGVGVFKKWCGNTTGSMMEVPLSVAAVAQPRREP